MDEQQTSDLRARVAMLEEAVFFLLRQMPKANMQEAFRMEMRSMAHGDAKCEEVVETWIGNLQARSSSLPDLA